MLLRLDFTLLKFIPFMPRGLKIIKKFLELGSAGGTAIKMIGSALFHMPLKVLKAVIKIQMKIVSLPFRVLNSFYELKFNRYRRAICDKYIEVNPVMEKKDSTKETSCSVSLATNSTEKQSGESSVLETPNLEQESSTENSPFIETVYEGNCYDEYGLLIGKDIPFVKKTAQYYLDYNQRLRVHFHKMMRGLRDKVLNSDDLKQLGKDKDQNRDQDDDEDDKEDRDQDDEDDKEDEDQDEDDKEDEDKDDEDDKEDRDQDEDDQEDDRDDEDDKEDEDQDEDKEKNSVKLNISGNNPNQPAIDLQKVPNGVIKGNLAKNLGNDCNTLRDAQYVTQAHYAFFPEMNKKRSLMFSDELFDLLNDITHENSERPIYSRYKKAKLEFDKQKEFLTVVNSKYNVFNKICDSANVPLTTEVSSAIKSLKNLQCKRSKLNKECNSITKNILTQILPAMKQAIRAVNPHMEQADGKMNTFEDFNLLEHKSPQRISKDKVLHEKTPKTHGQILHLSIEVLHSMVDIISQEIILLKRRLSSTNSKMAEVIKSSDSLFEQISNINERFGMLITLSTKVTNLQHELGEDKNILKEVEADRNEMQLKLVALEKLIKEEEEYLDDVSIESGYDEFEFRATSPYKRDDF